MQPARRGAANRNGDGDKCGYGDSPRSSRATHQRAVKCLASYARYPNGHPAGVSRDARPLFAGRQPVPRCDTGHARHTSDACTRHYCYPDQRPVRDKHRRCHRDAASGLHRA